MTKQHYIVVGGTRGTGRTLVEHLLTDQNKLVSVFGRRHEQDDEGKAALAAFTVDVLDADAARAALDAAIARHGKISGVVFMQRNRSAGDAFDADLGVALTATKTMIDHLVQQGSFSDDNVANSIVTVSSIADHYVAPEQDLGYHVSKAGLVQLSRYYALQLGNLGIRVNSVSPCVVIKDAAHEYYSKNSWITDRFARFIPLGRAGRSQDIVNAVMFLLSEQASYITGQNIVVDGGLTLRSHESIIRDFPRGE